MGKANKAEVQLAAALGTTWGTAIVLGAQDGYLGLPHSIKREQEALRDDSVGVYVPRGTDQGLITAEGDVPMYLRYGESIIDLLIALAMGTTGNPTYVAATVSSQATAGGATTLTDSTNPFGADNSLAGFYCSITAGTGIGQSRLIASNTISELTVAAWGVTPDNTSVYVVRKVTQGTATAGGATTLDDTDQAWTVDAFINRHIIITGGTGIGQSRKITDNTATQVTVEAWTTEPDNTSTYEISDTTAVHTHTFAVLDAIDGLFATLVQNNQVTTGEAASMKVMGFTIKGEPGGIIEATFHVLCDNYIHDSAGNTPATFANVTFREMDNRATFADAVFRINSDASALDGADALAIGPWELVWKRAQEGVHATGQANKIDEPSNAEQPEATFAFTLQRHTVTTYYQAWEAGTEYKGDLVLTGSGGRSIAFEMPNIQFIEWEQTQDGIFTEATKMNAHSIASAPAGMTGTSAFYVIIVDTYGGDPLQVGN